MIVLHAGVEGGAFLLWGEVPLDREGTPPERKGRRGSAQTSPPLPYDAGADRLVEALGEGGLGSIPKGERPEAVTVWLPTINGTPVASSPLIAEFPASRTKPILRPWKVTGLRLPIQKAIEVLAACADRPMLAPGVLVGKDLSFWATAMRFAGALVAGQQFLPSLAKENGLYRACWKPVLSGPNAERFAKLAKAMPAVARALTRETDSPPSVPSASVLKRFVEEVVDHLIRFSDRSSPPQVDRKRRGAAFSSVHDQWLYALRSVDGVMEGDEEELEEFLAQVQRWQRPVAVLTTAPFRLCLRLEEPGEKDPDRWRVRYFLQAVDDPSLLVPAHHAWKSEGDGASPSRGTRRTPLKILLDSYGGFNAKEYLLSSLGQASRFCPRIEASLNAVAPDGYDLDTLGAYEFLTEKAPALEQAGFGILLPSWWTRRGTKLRLTARAQVKSHPMQAKGRLSLDSIIQFDWQVALGKEQLTAEELFALAKLKVPLVKIRGQWVEVNAEEIRAAIDLLKKRGSATVGEIVQMALGAGKLPAPLAFGGVVARGWIADLLAQLEGRAAFDILPPPDGFQGTLRPYQVRGYSWLAFLRRWGLGACLADDMGLGKTIQTLALIQRDWESNGGRPVLVVCPTSVVGNWQKEAARFTPDLPVLVHHGIARAKGEAFKKKAESSAIVIVSYALLHRDLEVLKEVPWAGVILDEAQNIKNYETKQAKAARALQAGYRIALTGTPVENNVGELWSIMEFLNPGFLGGATEFKRRFFVPIQVYRDKDAMGHLKRLTGPFILRRLKTDKTIIADLPEKLEMKVFCTLTKEQASLYEAVVEETTSQLDSTKGIQRKGLILATIMKLKQICNHPAHFLGDHSRIPGRSGKLVRLTEMLEEILEVRDRALVFTQFAEMGAILQRYLQETFGREVLFLHGAVPKNQRDRMVERFQSDEDGPPIFVLSLKAGGLGLNLTRANHVFHFDRWWNPAVENQATDRVFRIGQTRNVQVHKFLCIGTLEERIDEMIEQKKEVAEMIVGTGEEWLTELSTAELKKLFALRKEAVGE